MHPPPPYSLITNYLPCDSLDKDYPPNERKTSYSGSLKLAR